MRTTINISEQVYRDAKALAALTSRTVSQVIEDAIRAELVRRPEQKPLVELPVFGGSGVMPGVDLADPRQMLDAMEQGGSFDALR